MIYNINAIIWSIFALIGAFFLKTPDYTYFALTIAIIWHVAGIVVRDINK